MIKINKEKVLLLNLDLIQNGYPAINVKFTDRKIL